MVTLSGVGRETNARAANCADVGNTRKHEEPDMNSVWVSIVGLLVVVVGLSIRMIRLDKRVTKLEQR